MKRSAFKTPLLHVSEIGEQARFSGELSSRESILLQGRFSGSLRCSSHVTVGPKGRLDHAKVFAKNLTVFGAFEGEAKARGFVELKARSASSCSIETNSLIVSDSARFEGLVRMPGIGD
ncbi:MAG: polymer-forming cytoskeletal protein [Spirochaetota bacterium]